MEYVLLVQGFWLKASWGFPKGKVNHLETPEACAVREVLEETGFDITGMVDKTQYAEHHLNEQLSRLYFVPNVPMDVEFKPKTRGEIKSVMWFQVDDLPAHRKDTTPKQALNLAANCFFMVMPFIKQLRRWIASNKGKITNDKLPSGGGKKLEKQIRASSGERSKLAPQAKQTSNKLSSSFNSGISLDKSVVSQQLDLFGRGNAGELESVTSLLKPDQTSKAKRRGAGRGRNHTPTKSQQKQDSCSLDNKGRGKLLDDDYLPDAWRNFQFDHAALEKAIMAFHKPTF